MGRYNSAYVIEWQNSDDLMSPLKYWRGGVDIGGVELVTDIHQATHFCRREDAQGVLDRSVYRILYRESKVEEHSWPEIKDNKK